MPPKALSPDPIPLANALESEAVRRVIQQRAYEIWQEENCPPGRDIENWVRAEQETLANSRLLKEILSRS